MTTVSVRTATSYDESLLRQSILDLLEPLGGIRAFVTPGDRVLLKPNMLAAKPPEAAVTTHPALVRAVIRLVQEAGGTAVVGDSPGIGSIHRVAEKSGIAAAVRDTGAELVPFTETVIHAGTGTFRSFDVARPYMEADKVINLPKLKTHEMMTLTCAVKNLFGIVVGTAKAAWHLKAGADRDLFARLVLEIALLRRPELTIVDGILAMEGDGPGSGDPISAGLLLAGSDPVAVDVIAADLCGIPARLLPVEKAARAMNLPGAERAGIDIVGTFSRPRPFRLPHQSDVQFGLPLFLKNRLRHYLTARPVQNREACRMCGICSEACPPRAITARSGRLEFDYHACIRCLCCRELCPYAALRVEDGILLKIIKRLK